VLPRQHSRTANRKADAALTAASNAASDVIMTTSSIHMPLELLEALRAAANRRAARKVRERGGPRSLPRQTTDCIYKIGNWPGSYFGAVSHLVSLTRWKHILP
jgi:hypothetical protein